MPKKTLEDPDYRRFAWRRYRSLMRWMTLIAAMSAAAALAVFYVAEGSLALHFAVAVALSVFFSIVLAAALMGLVFMSSGTGHDEVAGEQFEPLL